MHVFARGPAALRRWVTKRRVVARKVDVVHLNYVHPRHLVWTHMRGGPPYVATAWGSDLSDEVFKKSPEHAAQVATVLRGASAITADSAPLLDAARARLAATSTIPSELVYWGVDLELFDPGRCHESRDRWARELGVGEGEPVLLSPRQLQPHYHHDRILRAFAASRWAERGVLVMKLHQRDVGASLRASLEGLAAELGVAARLRFARPCAFTYLPGLYALASAAVSLPEADGVPSTFLELMALGVPIVASALRAYDGVLALGETGILVPPADRAALIAALDRLHAEPELVRGLSERGRAFARERADWRACVDRFEALYDVAVHEVRGAR